MRTQRATFSMPTTPPEGTPVSQPNVLIILTDQQRYPPGYESDE